MICKNCGTEFYGKACVYCGRPADDREMTFKEIDRAEGHDEDEKVEPQKKKKKKEAPALWRTQKGRIRFSRIFLPALMLLFPLLYFLVDIYTCLSDSLFALDAEGNTLISVLVDRLSSAEYGLNTMQEIQMITLGDAEPLYRSVSFFSRSTAGALHIPLWIVLSFAISSAIMGVSLIFSGGKLLRSRLALDLTLLAGTGAAFSPLLGLLCLRFYCFFTGGLSAADAAMARYTLSVESVLMIGLCICALLPSLAILRREAAVSRGSMVHVALPLSLVGGKSFGLVRLIAIVMLGVTVFFGLLQMLLPILPVGHLFQMGTAWGAVVADFKTFASSLWAVLTARAAEANFATLVATLMQLVFVLLSPVILLSLVFVFFSLWSILWAKKQTLCDKKRSCRSIQRVGARLRAVYLIPYWLYVAVQIFLVVVLLFGTKIVFHLDMGNVDGTLSLVYMLIGYTKGLGGTNTLYALIATLGALLWHATKNISCRLIDLSCRQRD